MKKIKEIDNKALIEYASNNMLIDDCEKEILEIKNRIKNLKEINKTILSTGKIPVFNSDDIPF